MKNSKEEGNKCWEGKKNLTELPKEDEIFNWGNSYNF